MTDQIERLRAELIASRRQAADDLDRLSCHRLSGQAKPGFKGISARYCAAMILGAESLRASAARLEEGAPKPPRAWPHSERLCALGDDPDDEAACPGGCEVCWELHDDLDEADLHEDLRDLSDREAEAAGGPADDGLDGLAEAGWHFGNRADDVAYAAWQAGR